MAGSRFNKWNAHNFQSREWSGLTRLHWWAGMATFGTARMHWNDWTMRVYTLLHYNKQSLLDGGYAMEQCDWLWILCPGIECVDVIGWYMEADMRSKLKIYWQECSSTRQKGNVCCFAVVWEYVHLGLICIFLSVMFAILYRNTLFDSDLRTV